MRDMHDANAARRWVIGLWLALLLVKLLLAARLPLFVDEAFYWQEGQHLAWAYSDLPGLTAWLARVGDSLAPGHVLALRLPFLLMGALLPWLLVWMSAREFGAPQRDARIGWWAGSLCLLLPLAGTLGLMALPDVPLLLASVLCLDAGLQLLRKVETWACAELALGLMIGGLTHYRFAAVIAVGVGALLLLREGRHALREPKTWLAIAIGALAWLPLLLWNWQHGDAGLRFQLVDRHPWAFSSDGWVLGAIQLLPATPLLLLAMGWVALRGLRTHHPAARYLALSGSAMVLGFLLLGFFADRQRVSFHWPLPGFVALLPLVAVWLATARRGMQGAVLAVTALGLLVALGFFAVAAMPAWRTQAAMRGMPLGNFAGWDVLADAVRARQMQPPAGMRVVAGDFKISAELGYALRDANIPVLAHPLNDKHGRAMQLSLWQLLQTSRHTLGQGPLLVVVSPSHAGFDGTQAYLRRLQAQLGPLPPAQILKVDAGAKQYWLFALPAQATPWLRHDETGLPQ